MMNKYSSQKGFTLLEVLLAVSITAGIGIGATQLLSSIMGTSQATEQRFLQLRYLQRMDLLLRRDFWQASGRAIKDEYGNIKQALTTDSNYLVEFTRSGQGLRKNINRSNLQRVAYAVRSHDSEFCNDAIKDPAATESSNCFIRFFWPVLDLAPDSEAPIVQVLLDEVDEVAFAFRGQAIDFDNPDNTIRNDDWQEEWPSPFVTPGMTLDLVQVKVTYTVKKLGEIERIYEVPRHAFIR